MVGLGVNVPEGGTKFSSRHSSRCGNIIRIEKFLNNGPV